MATQKELDAIHRKIEELMGWKEGDRESLSLRMCAVCIRGKDPKFDAYLADFIARGLHLFIDDPEIPKRFDY